MNPEDSDSAWNGEELLDYEYGEDSESSDSCLLSQSGSQCSVGTSVAVSLRREPVYQPHNSNNTTPRQTWKKPFNFWPHLKFGRLKALDGIFIPYSTDISPLVPDFRWKISKQNIQNFQKREGRKRKVDLNFSIVLDNKKKQSVSVEAGFSASGNQHTETCLEIVQKHEVSYEFKRDVEHERQENDASDMTVTILNSSFAKDPNGGSELAVFCGICLGFFKQTCQNYNCPLTHGIPQDFLRKLASLDYEALMNAYKFAKSECLLKECYKDFLEAFLEIANPKSVAIMITDCFHLDRSLVISILKAIEHAGYDVNPFLHLLTSDPYLHVDLANILLTFLVRDDFRRHWKTVLKLAQGRSEPLPSSIANDIVAFAISRLVPDKSLCQDVKREFFFTSLISLNELPDCLLSRFQDHLKHN